MDFRNNSISVGIDQSQLVPIITAQPASVSTLKGSTLQLAITATRATTYKWLKDNVPLPGATKSTLFLASLQASDAGSYTVLATNEYGTVTSSSAVVTVAENSTGQAGESFDSILRRNR